MGLVKARAEPRKTPMIEDEIRRLVDERVEKKVDELIDQRLVEICVDVSTTEKK